MENQSGLKALTFHRQYLLSETTEMVWKINRLFPISGLSFPIFICTARANQTMWPLLQIRCDKMLIQAWRGGIFLLLEGDVCVPALLTVQVRNFKDKWKKSKNVASCVQTRFILYMLGFSLITMHLGDQSHCVVGFRAAVNSYGAWMNDSKPEQGPNLSRQTVGGMSHAGCRNCILPSVNHFLNHSVWCVLLQLPTEIVTACHLLLWILASNKHERSRVK